MSGPGDRPSSREPDEEWPSEDLRTPGDAWSPSEPWREPNPPASSGWDDWPSPAPPDDYLIDEPDSSTDLWSESWSDEAGAEAAPAWSPPPAEQPRTEAPAPHVEPWSAEADPWAASAQPAAEPAAAEPAWEPQPEPSMPPAYEETPAVEPEAPIGAPPGYEPEPSFDQASTYEAEPSLDRPAAYEPEPSFAEPAPLAPEAPIIEPSTDEPEPSFAEAAAFEPGPSLTEPAFVPEAPIAERPAAEPEPSFGEPAPFTPEAPIAEPAAYEPEPSVEEPVPFAPEPSVEEPVAFAPAAPIVEPPTAEAEPTVEEPVGYAPEPSVEEAVAFAPEAPIVEPPPAEPGPAIEEPAAFASSSAVEEIPGDQAVEREPVDEWPPAAAEEVLSGAQPDSTPPVESPPWPAPDLEAEAGGPQPVDAPAVAEAPAIDAPALPAAAAAGALEDGAATVAGPDGPAAEVVGLDSATPDEVEAAAEPRRRPWWASGPTSWLGDRSSVTDAPIPESVGGAVGDVPRELMPKPDASKGVDAPGERDEVTPAAAAALAALAAAEPGVASIVREPETQPIGADAAPPTSGQTAERTGADHESADAVMTAKTEAAEPEATPVPAEELDSDLPPIWRAAPFLATSAPPEPAAAEASATSDQAAGAEAAVVRAAAEPTGAEPTAAEQQPAEPAWPEEVEGTQVLPSSWTPTAPAPHQGPAELEPKAGQVRTSFAARVGVEEAPEEVPTTAEQAVPWLIGLILLLAGMVIVLLALIFAGDASLGGAAVGPSASASPDPSGSADSFRSASPSSGTSAAPSASTAATPTPLAIPEYGALEMVYLGRSAPLAHIYLLRHDFTQTGEPEVLAQDPELDVRRVAWALDGRAGAGLYAELLISVEPGAAKRRLADGISSVIYGPDPATLYAVRVTPDGANDVATVLEFDFASGDSSDVASVNYARPTIAAEEPLPEAQFIDDGGPIRLFWMESGLIRLWILGAGTWEVDPDDGTISDPDGDLPVLWSPRGDQQIGIADEAGVTTLTLYDRDGATTAKTTVDGLVSHIRWSPDGDRVVFTVGRSAPGGGVLQDLFLWDLGDAEAPMQLTSTGAAFSAEWLGTLPLWRG
jgi:hypothetical protein